MELHWLGHACFRIRGKGATILTVTKGIKVGVQGVNLLNEVTRTSQMFTNSGLIGPRSYFVNDRRFSFIEVRSVHWPGGLNGQPAHARHRAYRRMAARR